MQCSASGRPPEVQGIAEGQQRLQVAMELLCARSGIHVSVSPADDDPYSPIQVNV